MTTPARPAERLPLAPAPIEVESEAGPGELAAMLERTGQYWERVGGEAPHWSVLTQERYRPERIAETRDEFYASGKTDLALVTGLLARHGMTPAARPRLLEFGCGVGRATLALARVFAVTGCDVSGPHLRLARREAAARGVAGIEWHRTRTRRPMPRGLWDVWFSRIVLQHNPPPVIAWLLREAFARLAPGGVAIFQVPTHAVGYRFRLSEYLARPEAPHMEMHVLPQRAVFALAAEAGLSVLEVREDHVVGQPGRWLSNLFVLQRPV
jgi:SAM-dependent methyltransferase